MSVNITDNTDEVLRELSGAKRRALERIGLQAVSYAKQELSKPKPHKDGELRPNVDTGLLRNSIAYAISGRGANISSYEADKGGKTGTYSGTAPKDRDMSVYIGTNVEYGSFVELGTSQSQAFPFLKPAATQHGAVYKRIMEEELKGT